MTKAQRKKKIDKIFKESEVMILVEDMRGDIKGIADGYDVLKKNINDLRREFHNEFDSFRSETRLNFKEIFKRLSSIENKLSEIKEEIKKIKVEKADRKDFEWLRSKVLDLEEKIKECQKQQASFAAKA